MLFKQIAYVDANFGVQQEGYIGTKDGKIAYVGREMPQENFGEVYDGRGKLALPAFYNNHAHSPMTLLRGYAENLPLQRWLEERVFPFEDAMQDEDAYYGTMLSIAEMLRGGTASFTDMYFFSEAVLKAVGESGVKCNFGRAITSFADGDIHDIQSFRESEALLKTYQNAFDGRVKLDMSLHAEYTNRRMVMEQFAQIAKEHGVHVHIHLSETEKENRECIERHGVSPTALFAACGVLDMPTTAAHCVWLTEEDRAILKEKDVTVATCPASNLKLGSGICDVQTLLEDGIRVTIGTDGAASNNKLDMLREMYLCALLPKGLHHRPEIVSEKEILKMATLNGAVAQGRTDCGQLSVGAKADLTVLSVESPHMYPQTDLLCNVVYAGSGADVVLTMVDGKVLYANGEFTTIDIEKVQFEVQNRAKKIIEKVQAHA